MMERNVALVTGGNSGIGAAITRELLVQDCYVFGTYCRHAGRAQQLKDAERGEGRLQFEHWDFSAPEKPPARLVDHVIDCFGDLNWIVNCAADVSLTPFAEVTHIEFERMLQVNLETPFFIAQSAIAAHNQQRCALTSIVNVSSIADRFARKDNSIYEITKAGLSMLTRSLALELAGMGIRVNAVAPGAIDVDRNRHDPNWAPRVISRVTPLGRPGAPVEVARTVYHLLSNGSSYTTGQILYIDGGLSVRV